MELVVIVGISLIFTLFFLIQILTLFWMLADVGTGKMQWMSRYDEQSSNMANDPPLVSILLAARNEEKLIIRSLESIERLNYPPDKLQVLIGDDMSDDNTAELVAEFIEDLPNFRLIKISGNIGKGRGKANVLAQLAHEADGEFYFITDVDVQLPENWIQAILGQFKPEVGIASGITMCARGELFATMQSIDWLHFMGYIKAFAKVGVACTSVGNNMAIRAKAYWETGGYENIDFSITEDYKLFKEVTALGWGWSNSLDAESLGIAKHIGSLPEMLHQRKRWLIGARELPMNWKFLILLYGLFIPAMAVLFSINPALALLSWFLKLMAQTTFITVLTIKLKVKPFKFWQLIIYEFYVLFNTLATALFYFLPIKSVWKGRTYNKAYIGE